VTQFKTSTRPQYKEEDEATRKERMGAYIKLLTREAIRKMNGGWLGESSKLKLLSAASSGGCGVIES